MTTHRIIVAQCPRRKNGSFNPDFMAWYEGKLIVAASREPLLDACRVLLARGLSGPVEMWDRLRSFPRLQITIEIGADLTVEESGAGPRFRKWRASRVERPWTAKRDSALSHYPKIETTVFDRHRPAGKGM
jgi:hypothetical protein